MSEYPLVYASAQDIASAKRLRAERDRVYPNLYRELPGHERWVGDLGEQLFDRWIRALRTDVEFHDELCAAGRPDFTIGGRTVGVKTVKRTVPMRPGYTAQISTKHAEEPVDYFFFCSYEAPKQRLWLLGGISVARFMRFARHYGPGEQVHPGYTVPDDHAIYNAPVDILVRPALWLDTLAWPQDPVTDPSLDF